MKKNMFPKSKIKKLTQDLSNICLNAGEFLKTHVNEINKEVHSSLKKDFKLSGDLLTEKLIISSLEKISSYPIISEETLNSTELPKASPFWIIDPIDGTMNLNRQFPMACISIALWEENHPILGIVYDLFRDKIYSLDTMTPQSLSSKPESIDQAILATGFPVYMDYSSQNIENFTLRVSAFKKIRMIGSAALSLCYVAMRSFDVYYEENIMIWDVAGGLALLDSNGGKFKLIETPQPLCYNVVASHCPSLFDKTIELCAHHL